MGRPRVFVSGSVRGSRIAWLASRFLLRNAGLDPRFVSPVSAPDEAAMEGLLILGGVDIDPSTYGGRGHPAIGRSEPERDRLELRLLEASAKRNLPVLGICRGMQLINLFHGGTLHPHIHDLDLSHPHPHTPLPLRWVTIEPATTLHALLGVDRIRANALHHQAVDRIGAGLRKAAYDANGIIQAVESTEERFVTGLQWHPEFMPYLWHSRRIFSAFAAAVRKRCG
ncbi:gamma-glutamyl-gamma-aminobutyrate hydrolase family protein [Hydrogenimonas sp. SS33]|uniref:gamma-glutamyl-gamma-aminobutyrate hydrolase family protein n=1 Tax=Hydrogenimonas leucolamina TaxID=2954236 RepID=UPI00336BDC79